MQNLGDLFPNELKEQFAEDNFKIGAVLKYHDTSTNPPKLKIRVIVGFDNQKVFMASVYINSEINPNIFRSPQARKQHLELDATTRDYLDHTSYVDCSKLRVKEAAIIKNLITDDPNVHIGELASSDLTDVLDKIKNSVNITPSEKKRFGFI